MKSIEVDYGKRCADEPDKGHNRWHPDIPPALEVEAGEEVVLQTRDALDGQLGPDSTASDLGNVDRNLVHALTGPAFVKGARPGDLLEIEIMEIEPARWGFTSILPGFGFLRDLFLEPFLVKWSIDGKSAESPDLPDVRIPAAPFMGTIGVAPSHELRKEALHRERGAAERGGIALPPEPEGAVPSQEPVASEGLRTMPPRENGGNLDIKQLTAGTRLFCPVFVEGALFSVGDGHFAQGDSECCGTAVEMACTVSVRFRVREGEAEGRGIRYPMFGADDYYTSPEMAAPRRFLATTGMPIADGVNESENVTLAARQALLN
ncbi:MAG: acetamidase/formamidase family protein, partial [Dehalococcoidia bacterium]